MANELQVLSKLDHQITHGFSGPAGFYYIDEDGVGHSVDADDGFLGVIFVGGISYRADSLGATSSPSPDSSYWELCDGGVISNSDSIYNGKSTPNLNDRFLRGTTGSTGGTGGSTSHSHTAYQRPLCEAEFCAGSSGRYVLTDQNNLSTSSANHLPPYYDVEAWLRVL